MDKMVGMEPIKLYEPVMIALRATRYRWPEVSEGSGVPISTLRKIAQGHIKAPSVQTVEALYNWFRSNRPDALVEKAA